MSQQRQVTPSSHKGMNMEGGERGLVDKF